MKKNLQKMYSKDFNLLTGYDLWQAHYQIFSIILLKEFIKLNVNTDTMIKNLKLSEDDLIECKCLFCNKNYQQKFDEKLKERFFNTYKFSNHDNNKFILLLQKGAYPYEYMDDWEKFNETSLPEKEDFYSHLNMEDISHGDYSHAKRVCKDFSL